METVVVAKGNPDNSTRGLLSAILSSAVGHSTVGVDGPLYGAFVGLYTNNVDVTEDTTIADLTPATFDGYALSAAITWTPGLVDETGEPYVLGTMKTFTPTGDDTPNTIYGWYVVGNDSVTLKYGAKLDEPLPLTTSEALSIVPTYMLHAGA